MLKTILEKISDFLVDKSSMIPEDYLVQLNTKIEKDKSTYKFINLYAPTAKLHLCECLSLLNQYTNEMGILKNYVDHSNKINSEIHLLKDEINNIFVLLQEKKLKIKNIQHKLPEGMLDVKRALLLEKELELSSSDDEKHLIHEHLDHLKKLMISANNQFNSLIKKGGNLNEVLFQINLFYWIKFSEYTEKLKECVNYLNSCSHLTEHGKLALDCISQSFSKTYNEKECKSVIKLLAKSNLLPPHLDFTTIESRTACIYLSSQNESFFHMPHNEAMYHIDYDPSDDLAETGGNCFGESMMIIQSLSMGKLKLFCPESELINFQLDQERSLAFKQKKLSQGKTTVTASSIYKSVQWDDVKSVFIDNPAFIPGALCGLIFSMNAYIKAQKEFSPRHIFVVAKLDTALNPYKYIIFEKELGVFGLTSDKALQYIIEKQIMLMYAGMNYSNVKLVQYGKASRETYEFLNSIKPIQNNEPRSIDRLKNNFFSAAKTEASVGSGTYSIAEKSGKRRT